MVGAYDRPMCQYSAHSGTNVRLVNGRSVTVRCVQHNRSFVIRSTLGSTVLIRSQLSVAVSMDSRRYFFGT